MKFNVIYYTVVFTAFNVCVGEAGGERAAFVTPSISSSPASTELGRDGGGAGAWHLRAGVPAERHCAAEHGADHPETPTWCVYTRAHRHTPTRTHTHLDYCVVTVLSLCLSMFSASLRFLSHAIRLQVQ